MKVVLVCPYAWDRPGGVQSHVRSLARALVGRSHDVAVVAPLGSALAGAPARADAFSLEPVGRTFTVPANGSVAPISFGPRVARALERRLDALAPDVIHVHEPLIPSLSLLTLGATEPPIVGTFHAARPASAGYRAARHWLSARADRLAARTAVSAAARALASRYFPGDYTITPNGVDVRRFATARPLDLGPKKIVLFVGRVERRKGLETLVQAVAALGDDDVRLVVVGEGPKLHATRTLASRLGVDSVWLGRLDDATLARAYRSADVYCAPNLGGESFGIVLLEAMAAGAPVVCSRLDAFVEVAKNAALYAPPGNPQALAARLGESLARGPSVAAGVENGRERAARFDWGRLARDLEEVYAEARRRS